MIDNASALREYSPDGVDADRASSDHAYRPSPQEWQWDSEDDTHHPTFRRYLLAEPPSSYHTEASLVLPLQGSAALPLQNTDLDVYRPDLEQQLAGYRWMLELGEDWDGEGASPVHIDAFNRAVDFTRKAVAGAAARQGGAADIPKLSPGPMGSVDVHWEYPNRELAVNISADHRTLATFYFRNDEGTRIHGEGSNAAVASLVFRLLHL